MRCTTPKAAYIQLLQDKFQSKFDRECRHEASSRIGHGLRVCVPKPHSAKDKAIRRVTIHESKLFSLRVSLILNISAGSA